jgi:hypothetical protein
MSSTLPGNENEVIYRFSFGMLFSHFPDLATWHRDAIPDIVGMLQKLLIAVVCLLTWAKMKSKESYSYGYKKGNMRLDNKLHTLHSYKSVKHVKDM